MKHLDVFEKFYHPTLEIKSRLKKIIDDLLVKHKGGKDFFDALDNSIKEVYNEDMILALLKGNTNIWIATSGGFGDKIYKLWKEKKFKCKGVIVFNGKMMTNNSEVSSWYPTNFDINNKEFVYIDDSYFSGGTSNKIKKFLSDRGSSLKYISVIYDGSKNKNKFVKSFFRYYK